MCYDVSIKKAEGIVTFLLNKTELLPFGAVCHERRNTEIVPSGFFIVEIAEG